MGYRSDVAYVIKFKDSLMRENFAELVRQRNDTHMTEALDETKCMGPYIYAKFEDVKWYSSYPDVLAHHKLMYFASEAFPDDAAWRFLRVGEEVQDIEEQDNDPDYELDHMIYARRSIEVDLDIPEETDQVNQPQE